VATAAVIDHMAPLKRKEVVVYGFRVPLSARKAVTGCTVGIKIELYVIGFFSGFVIRPVTIDAGHSGGPKPDIGFTDMALIAVNSRMDAHKREGDLFMHFCHILHDPGDWCMAPGTVIAHGHLMHIRVAGDTVCFCFLKYRACVAGPAIQVLVLTRKRERCAVMRKSRCLCRKQPVFRAVAFCTVYGKVIPVRVLSRQHWA